jgi:hypothetical protein
MASTFTLQNTINWTLSFLEQQPLEINGMQPALDSANLVLSTILGPPLSWPFNRSIISYATANQDYQQVGLFDFAFPEGGTVQPTNTPSAKPWEISVKMILFSDAAPARPQYIAPFIDDGMGNITFRFHPAPDQSYTAVIPYQKKPPTMLSMAYTWYPVPDQNYYLCQWGFLALMSLIGNDARFNEYNAKFISSILGAQGGLTDMERNIFLSNWTRVMAQLQATQLETSQSYKARQT